MIYKKSLRKWSAQTLEEKVQWILTIIPSTRKMQSYYVGNTPRAMQGKALEKAFGNK